MAAPMSHDIWRKKLNEHHLFESLRENKEKQRPPKECKKLLAIKDGEIFVWDAYRTCLLTTNLKSLAQKQENPCQVGSSKVHTKAVKITFLTVFPTLDGCNFGFIQYFFTIFFLIFGIAISHHSSNPHAF